MLFAAADAIEEAGMRLREQQDLSGAPLAALLPRLDAAVLSDQGRSTDAETGGQAEARNRCGFIPSPCLLIPLSPCLPVPRPLAPDSFGSRFRRETGCLLARNGELLVARRRVQARVEELTAVREFVARWKAEWRSVEKEIVAAGPASRATPEAHPARLGSRGLPRRAARVLERVGDNLRQVDKDLEYLAAAMGADGRVLKEAAGAIDDEVRRVRMLPFAEACQGLDRMVRDLAQASGKEVELAIQGGDVELDRSVLEGLKDPLRHLLRNAVDHGAEPPEERRAASKPSALRLTVSAAVRGAQVEVVVEDDGRGLNLDALRLQLRKKGLPEPTDAAELARVVFLPGFSTSRFITDVSGRGVGLDVVKSRVEALHGSVDLDFTPGARHAFHAVRAVDTDDAARAAARGRRPDVCSGRRQRPEAGAGRRRPGAIRGGPADARAGRGARAAGLAGGNASACAPHPHPPPREGEGGGGGRRRARRRWCCSPWERSGWLLWSMSSRRSKRWWSRAWGAGAADALRVGGDDPAVRKDRPGA